MRVTPHGVAVIGYGRMGRRRAKAVRSSKDFQLIHIVDPDDERRLAGGRDFECNSSTSFSSALADPDLGVVFVCTPNVTHADIVRMFLEAGKHVFCEKPLCVTWEEARAIAALAKKVDCRVQIGANARYFPNVQKAKDVINSNRIGELTFGRAWIGHDGWVLKTTPWSSNYDIAGGGVLADNGHHLIDLVRWFLGDIRSVQGVRSTLVHNLDARLEDNFLGILTTERSNPVFIQASWTDWNGYLYLEVYGTQGYILVDSRGDAALTLVSTKTGQIERFDFSGMPKDSWEKETHAFLDGITRSDRFGPDATDAMAILRVTQALYESSSTGKVVNLNRLD